MSNTYNFFSISLANLNISPNNIIPSLYDVSITVNTQSNSNTIGDATGTQAFRIADMMEKFGVNTFSDDGTFNSWGAYPAQYNANSVIEAINYITGNSGMIMNIREYHYNGAGSDPNYRTNMQNVWCPEVASVTGSKFTICLGSGADVTDVSGLQTLANTSKTTGNWLQWIEGLNEPNDQSYVPIANVISIQQSIDNIGVANVMGPSLVFGLPYPYGYIVPPYMTQTNANTLGTMQTATNIHFYPPYNPDIDDGSNSSGMFNEIKVGFNQLWNTPQFITEWHPTLFNSKGHVSNPTYDSYYAPMFCLSAFRANYQGWWWYALFDFGTTYTCGLFPTSGTDTPRPVANTIKAMYNLPGDNGSNKHTFTPGNLNYTITGLPSPLNNSPNSGGQSMLFQNSNGMFALYVWNSQQNPGGNNHPITINFNGKPVTQVIEYNISGNTPFNVIQTANNVASVSANLNTEVLLFTIKY